VWESVNIMLEFHCKPCSSTGGWSLTEVQDTIRGNFRAEESFPFAPTRPSSVHIRSGGLLPGRRPLPSQCGPKVGGHLPVAENAASGWRAWQRSIRMVWDGSAEVRAGWLVGGSSEC
jgi:hypothetical protein